MKIIIAEDDITSRLVLESIVTKLSFETISTDNGDEAFEIIRKEESELIGIIDWEMPGTNGLELCSKVKELEKPYPLYLILLTGRNSKKDIVSGLRAGADDYITKPFDNAELQARIDVAHRLISAQLMLNNKVAELEKALQHVQTLQGILPICMHCHSIRNDEQAWHRLEKYIEEHSEIQFSHSICPKCLEEHYPEFG